MLFAISSEICISAEVPWLHTLCQTHRTVRAGSLLSIRLNYQLLEATWGEAIDIVKESSNKRGCR